MGTGCVPEAQARHPRKATKGSLPEVPATLSLQSRSSVQQGDLDGARRLGRLARLLSITFIIMGIIIIIVAVTVNFTGEAEPHGSEGAGLLGMRTMAGCSLHPWVRGGHKSHGATALSCHSRKGTQCPAVTC